MHIQDFKFHLIYILIINYLHFILLQNYNMMEGNKKIEELHIEMVVLQDNQQQEEKKMTNYLLSTKNGIEKIMTQFQKL